MAREIAKAVPQASCLGREQADLSDPDACARAIRAAAPQAVINAAAWTNVDGAEDSPETAMSVNGRAPGVMAGACAALGVPLVHISTDYVFDGSGRTPVAPDAPTAPLGAYGASKLAGERAVVDAGGTFAVLRTSWVFSAHGTNFVKTMLRLAETRDKLTIVADQVGGPTPANAIAAACVRIAEALAADPDKRGVYHFSGAPDVSWADFARAIFAAAGREVTVEDIPSSAYPTRARRPLNSRLDCRTTEATFGIARPDWRASLDQIIEEVT